MNPIEAAVAPLKTDAIARAEQEARNLVAHQTRRLAECEGNIDTLAPYPNSRTDDRERYAEKKRRRLLIEALTTLQNYDSVKYDPRAPRIVAIDDAKVEAFVEQAKRMAGEQYDAFVAKLTAKIGDVDDAALNGNHVWDSSVLSVRKGMTLEHWKTQQIVNVSKLGTLFNQWPTRKVKIK